MGSESEPWAIDCPECGGHGCDHCSDGEYLIGGCPNAYCRDMIPLIDIIDLFGKGLPPVVGGSLDQSVSFIQAARFFDTEERIVANERIGRNSDQG